MKTLNTLLAMFAIAGGFLLTYHSCLAQEAPLVWTSTHTSMAPRIDGRIDSGWSNAKALTVTIREAIGGGASMDVVLRALHTNDSLYVLAQWPDTTRSDMRDPYIWNKDTNQYERPTKADDQFAIEFPLEGDFLISMLPEEHAYTADVWHWKAGRSNLDGWVDDKRHIISNVPVEKAKEYSMGGHTTVYISRPMDEGQAAYRTKPDPKAYAGDVIPSYEAQQPSASLTDIPGKGIHNGTGWTLELTRKFNTGNSDDAVIDPEQSIICAIAVLNDELYWNHSVSQEISLRFSE